MQAALFYLGYQTSRLETQLKLRSIKTAKLTERTSGVAVQSYNGPAGHATVEEFPFWCFSLTQIRLSSHKISMFIEKPFD